MSDPESPDHSGDPESQTHSIGFTSGQPVGWREALWAWIAIAAQSFGGPAGQVAVMHRILVQQKKWLTDHEFVHALQFCMLLPGPEAQQLCTWVGWRLFGWRGGLTAGLIFVFPGFVSLWILSSLYLSTHEIPAVSAALGGIQAAVVVIVLDAVWRLGRRILKTRWQLVVAIASALASELLRASFPLVILVAAVIGWVWGQVSGTKPPVVGHKGGGGTTSEGAAVSRLRQLPHVSLAGTFRTGFLWLSVWWLPVAAIAGGFGMEHILTRQSVFFSGLAAMSFGGAYAVLNMLAESAVLTYGWVTLPEMQDAIGFAETTPGPLIQVVQFVAYLGAAREPAPFTPAVAGTIASVLCTWCTFAPSFLWIFTFGPYVDRLEKAVWAKWVLAGISAAVVGVIARLGWTLFCRTLFSEQQTEVWGAITTTLPTLVSYDPGAWVVALLAGILVWLGRWNLGVVVIVAAAAGWLVG